MFLKQARFKNGKTFLSIVEGYHDPVSKKSKQRTIQTIGYLEDLTDQYEDPVAHFKQLAKQMTLDRQTAQAPISLEIDPTEKLIANPESKKNLGYAVLSKTYHDLGLHTFVTNKARHKKFTFNANTWLARQNL